MDSTKSTGRLNRCRGTHFQVSGRSDDQHSTTATATGSGSRSLNAALAASTGEQDGAVDPHRTIDHDSQRSAATATATAIVDDRDRSRGGAPCSGSTSTSTTATPELNPQGIGCREAAISIMASIGQVVGRGDDSWLAVASTTTATGIAGSSGVDRRRDHQVERSTTATSELSCSRWSDTGDLLGGCIEFHHRARSASTSARAAQSTGSRSGPCHPLQTILSGEVEGSRHQEYQVIRIPGTGAANHHRRIDGTGQLDDRILLQIEGAHLKLAGSSPDKDLDRRIFRHIVN